ncbi:glycosyltransferase family 4 protein [Pedobacter sandarakinus]|uniref:glycosyltransferase family 4 protein n=1 Tax=Pedobacter sandarakinus TaxID=353156 RepID=UPI00224505FC|nr:glycosyltransferase family 4 protein [Pedobacter sandarakinus]MCX2575908.1 glycosyltransferase family 4 protein [Pedobacter sandarakinus]
MSTFIPEEKMVNNLPKLAIIVSHPIQYYAPFFRLLSVNVNLKVFYTLGDAEQYDAGFKQQVRWDLPLLEGYDYEFLSNTSAQPGSHHRNGIVNPDLIAHITNFEPRAILIYGWAYHSHLQAMKHFKGKLPVWFRGDSTLLDLQPLYRKILRKIYLRSVYKNVDHAFYVGTNNYQYFKAAGLQDRQLTFSPHAVDNERFSTDRSIEAQNLRTQLQIPSSAILILFAGKFETKKSPLLLLDAFLQLKNRNAHLLFVGNGDLEESLKFKVQSLKSEVRSANVGSGPSIVNPIHFMDFQNQTQMPVLYQACDLFCLPSGGPAETWGLAVNEAMAAGRAALVSNRVGCAVDLVYDRENGAVFNAGDVADLLEKLSILCRSKSLLQEMGKKSKEKIAQWSFENQVKAFLSAF